MQWQIHHKKSQSAIVGAIIFIIAAFIIAGVMLSLINYNQNVLLTQKNSIQVQQMVSLMEKDILAYYNYTNNNIYINVSGMAYPYSYYISGVSVILKNGSYLIYDTYTKSNNLQILVKSANGVITYNSLPVSVPLNSSALIIIKNVISQPTGISISVVNGKAIASIPVENIQQLISALRSTGVVYIVPPVKTIITNKYFNVSFNIVNLSYPPPESIISGNYNWSVSFYMKTKYNIGIIDVNGNHISFSNGSNITFTNIPSGYYYYYNISNLYIITNKNYYICYPNPSSGVILVNQNTNVSIIYTCNKFSSNGNSNEN